MIKPIIRQDLYQHWIDAVNGLRPGVQLDDPQCGYYKTRKVKNGPWLPIAIWCEQEFDDQNNAAGDEYLVATLNGNPTDVIKIWEWCRPISEPVFKHLTNPQAIVEPETQIQAGADLTDLPPIF